MSVSDMNYQEIPQVIEFAEKIGAVAFNLYFLVCTGRGQGNTDISNEAYEQALKILYEQQMKYKGRLMINSKCAPQYKRVVYENDPDSVYQRTYSGGCPAGTHYSRISPEGDLTPCPFIAESVGNLKTDTFKNLWETAPAHGATARPQKAGRPMRQLRVFHHVFRVPGRSPTNF